MAEMNELEYKGRPLRRKDNVLYYGSMAEKYIIMMQVLETKKIQDMDVATKVSVQLQFTDPNLKSRDKVVKKSEKNSLYVQWILAPCGWTERSLPDNASLRVTRKSKAKVKQICLEN